MKVFINGIFLFLLAFILHFVIWKVRIPKRQIKALLLIFYSTLIAGLMIVKQDYFTIPFMNVYAPSSLFEYIHISLLFISITFVYIELYSTLETGSPSLIIITNIAKAGPEGLDKELLERSMDLLINNKLIEDRLRCIIRDNMVYIDERKFMLTCKGNLFIRVLIFYRKLLKITEKYG